MFLQKKIRLCHIKKIFCALWFRYGSSWRVKDDFFTVKIRKSLAISLYVWYFMISVVSYFVTLFK